MLGACLGGQTGTEGDAPGAGEGGPYCQRLATLLAADEPSPFGFKPAELALLVAGNRSAELRWRAAPAFATYGPEAGQSSIRVDLIPRATPTRHVRWVQSGNTGTNLGCPQPTVELDVAAVVTTAGGALNESVAAVVSAQSATRANLSVGLQLDSIAGTFAVSPLAPYRTDALWLNAVIERETMSGTLSGLFERTEGGVASATYFTYACWPANEASCLSGP